MPANILNLPACTVTALEQNDHGYRIEYESLPDIDDRHPMTSRRVAWIGKQANKRTFAGIDEIHLIRPRGVIANIQSNTIVERLPNRNKDSRNDAKSAPTYKEKIATWKAHE